MPHAPRLIATLLATAFLAGCGLAGGGNGLPPMAALRPASAGFDAQGLSHRELVVKLKSAVRPAALASAHVRTTIAGLNTLIVDCDAGHDATQLASRLAGDQGVAYASPVKRVVLEHTVDDPRAPEQYALPLLHLDAAWDLTMGDPGVTVAVIDSGIDMHHPDLQDRIDPASVNLIDPGTPPLDDLGHGTHCAGIIAASADNGLGIAGVAPVCRLMAVKVLDGEGAGSDATIAAGIIYATDHGAKVLSMSLGLYQRSRVLEDALAYALARDVVVVASAGNNASENDPVSAPHLPSTYPGVIEVGATDAQDHKAKFSNWGKTLALVAPGVNVLSTLPTYPVPGLPQSYGTMSGTSMSAPFVAGVAALIRAQNPALSRTEVLDRLEVGAHDLGEPGCDPIYGYGRIDALGALQAD